MRDRTTRAWWRVLWLATCLIGATGSAPLPAQVFRDSAATAAPVVFEGDTLFLLHARLGAFTAAERAAGVSARLPRVGLRVGAGADSIVVVDGETHTDLVVGETVLMTVLDGDLAPGDSSRVATATRYARLLTGTLRNAAHRSSMKNLLLGGLFTLLATLALLAIFKLIAVFYPRLTQAIERRRNSGIPAFRIQRFEIVSATRITDFLLAFLRVLRTALVVLLLYFYVPLVLSFFPWTAPMGERILGYVVTPLASMGRAVAGYIPNLFFIAVVIVVTRYFLKFIHLFFDAISRGAVVLPGFYREWGEPTYKIVRVLVIAFVVVVIFPYLPGAGNDAFKGVSIFLGALFTLGSSSAIANVVAGTVLTYTRAFQVGDRVQIGTTMGDVIEKSLLVTRIRTIKNEEITVPNAQVLSSHITNYSAVARQRGLILHTTVTIGYDAPWRRVHELLVAAAKATSHVLATPEPFVLQTSLDDNYVSYQINAYTDQPAAMAQIYSELHQQIQDAFNAGGVEILSPAYRALRDGNAVAMPEDALPPGYRAPAFRVAQAPGASGESPG